MSYCPPFYYGQPGQQHPATTPPQPSHQTVVLPGFITETVITPATHMPWHTSVQYRGPQSMATGQTVQTQLQTVQAQLTGQSLISGRNVWPSMPTATYRTEGTTQVTPTPVTPTTQSVSSPNVQCVTPPPFIKTEQGEEMVYLAIPKGEMNRKEIHSLLGENVEEGNCESDVHESKTVKMELAMKVLMVQSQLTSQQDRCQPLIPVLFPKERGWSMGKFLFLFFLLGTVISNSNCKQNWLLFESTDYDRL